MKEDFKKGLILCLCGMVALVGPIVGVVLNGLSGALFFLLLLSAGALFIGIRLLQSTYAAKKMLPYVDREIVYRGLEEKVKSQYTTLALKQYARLQPIKNEFLQRADENFKAGTWPFSSDSFYQRCLKNNIESIDTPFAEQKVMAIAKSMLSDAEISDKCIAECLTLDRIQKFFDEAVAESQRIAAEKKRAAKLAEQRRKIEENRKKITPVKSKFNAENQRTYDLTLQLAKLFGASKRKAMLEAIAEQNEKMLAALSQEHAALIEANENKFKNAALLMSATPQEDKLDWGTLGGIAHAIGGAAAGAAVALDAMRENAEIEARNEARRAEWAKMAQGIIDSDNSPRIKEVYDEIVQLSPQVKQLQEEIALTEDKLVFASPKTVELSKQITISDEQVVQHKDYLEVSFIIENNCCADIPTGGTVVLDGTAFVKIYSESIYVGSATVALPVYGIEQGKRCRVSGFSSHYLVGKPQYRIEVSFNKLWLMEK